MEPISTRFKRTFRAYSQEPASPSTSTIPAPDSNPQHTSHPDTDNSSPEPPSDPPLIPPDFIKHYQLGSTPFHQVFACSVINKAANRADLVALTSSILAHLGTITAVEIVYFSTGKKAAEIVMAVSFLDPAVAKTACARRQFMVPSQFRHKGNKLIVYPKLSEAEHPASEDGCPKASSDKASASSASGGPTQDQPSSQPSSQPHQDSDHKIDPSPSKPDEAADTSIESCAQASSKASGSRSASDHAAQPADQHSIHQASLPPPRKARKLKSSSPVASPKRESRRRPSSSSSRSRHVIAVATIHCSTTRSDTVDMAHEILGAVGHISELEVLAFERRKSIDVVLRVSFDRASAAREACARRRFRVPSAYHYHCYDLLVFEGSSRRPEITPTPPDSPRPSSERDGRSRVSRRDARPPHDEETVRSRPATPAQEIDQLSSSPDRKPIDMLSSDPIAPEPSAPQPSASSDPGQSGLDQLDDPQEPPLKKIKTRRLDADKSPAEAPPQQAPSPIQSPPAASSSLPGSVDQVFATGLIHQSCTREKIPQMVRDILGFLGPISEVEVLSFVGRRISREVLLAITFVQISAAREAFFRRTFDIPSPYSFHNTPLTVHRTNPAVRVQNPPARPQPPPESPRQTSPQSSSIELDRPLVAPNPASEDSQPAVDEDLPHDGTRPKSSAEASVEQPPCDSRSDSAQMQESSVEMQEESGSEDEPLWQRVVKDGPPADSAAPPTQRSASPLTVNSDHPNIHIEPPDEPPVAQKDYHSTGIEIIKRPVPRKRVRHKTVWIKGSFPRKINNQKEQAARKERLLQCKSRESPDAPCPSDASGSPPPPEPDSSSQSDHPSCSVNRLHYKLEKIRLTTSKNQTVIDSSWEGECLTLHVVPNSDEHSQLPEETEPDNITTAASESRPVASTSSSATRHRSRSSEAPPKRSPKTHRSWPFAPAPMYLDESTSSDFPRTLNDFLTTFFRLWEESREDLRYLYDDSAVFSNILAKQGRKASAITKSTGWTSILSSISRLPALSNDPMSDLIIDASPISLLPLRVICSIHGSFSEFPNKVRRAFDRSLILRPVDVHLHPSEGCLGLLKWIILSDTLTIRKQTSRATAVTEGFRDIQKSRACREMGSDYHQAREVFQQSLRSSRRQSSPAGEPSRARRSSSIHSIRDSPRPPIVPSSSVLDCPPGTSLRSGSEAVAGPDLALLQSQVKVLQAEIESLKTQTRMPAMIPGGDDSLVSGKKAQRAKGDEWASGTGRPRKTHVSLVASRTTSHLGFGVAKKRLLLPTDDGRYLVLSIRGDILAWDPAPAPGLHPLQLVLPGASPTDIVDSAVFDLPSNALVVGARTSKAARNTPTSNVSLVKIFKTKKGTTMYDRLLLDDPIHEHGVLATCLAPPPGPATLAVDEPPSRTHTRFLTAGHDKFLGLWKISHSVHKKKALLAAKDLVKIPAFHAGVIQSLCLFDKRNWVLSGGHDGKVFATDLGQAFHHTLCLEENSRIFDIQTNPVGSDTVMVTTGNKAPGSQFRYCDLRTPARPVLSFGFGSSSAMVGGGIAGGAGGEKGTRNHRRGGLHDYLFCYPNPEPAAEVLLWDLRFPASAFSPHPSSSSSFPAAFDGPLPQPFGFGAGQGALASQTYLENLHSLAVLHKEVLAKIDFDLIVR
ncbi:hypothetical protein PtB15_3B423 [Puccinia triticina]|nr:hypothetical protein PtB15_3B423 [Puccinia triticina]